jgi:amidohydrolase
MIIYLFNRRTPVNYDLNKIKNIIDASILANKEDTFRLASHLEKLPETGFQEYSTMETLRKFIEYQLSDCNIKMETGIARTGLVATAGPETSPEIVLIADMDALKTHDAPEGLMHSCGHHAQMAVMLAVFAAICKENIPEKCGFRLSFVATPAEEYTEMNFRQELRKKGDIKYLSGKQELIRLGIFDSASCVIKYHSMSNSPERVATVNGTLNGFIAKQALFQGKAAHAGSAPHKGINALNAASIALMAIHASRETFQDEDHIRVHPILKEDGMTVNTVPEHVLIETYIRGATIEAIADAAHKIDRALVSGALATGSAVKISTTPGYQPFIPSLSLGELLKESVAHFLPSNLIDLHDHSYASDDIGDVALLVPSCQLGFSGFSGMIHTANFKVHDPDQAYIQPARIIADLVLKLGTDHAKNAEIIRDSFKPLLEKSAYLEYLDKNFSEKSIDFRDEFIIEKLHYCYEPCIRS